jgi:hypothetical protein
VAVLSAVKKFDSTIIRQGRATMEVVKASIRQKYEAIKLMYKPEAEYSS